MFEFMLSEEGTDLFTYGVEGVHYKVENGRESEPHGAGRKRL